MRNDAAMTRAEAERFAREWAAAWNRRDREAVLAHFAADVRFASPKALALMGTPAVRGREALRAYWQRALAAITSLHFAVDRVIWDPSSRELSIVYDREVNGQRDRASEILRFDAGGLVTHGEVHYGVAPDLPSADG
jgi:hypothetical protein